MANTYTQLHVQMVFAVKGRYNFIAEEHREQLEKYICGILSHRKCKPLAIYCNPDHIHILSGLHPTKAVADLTEEIKVVSSRFINDQDWISYKFHWQDGYGAFTYSKSQIDAVARYIINQRQHHRKRTFKDEYISILRKQEIEYEDEYLFEWYF